MKKFLSIILMFFGAIGIALAQTAEKTKGAPTDDWSYDHMNTFEHVLVWIIIVCFFLYALINLILAIARAFGYEDND